MISDPVVSVVLPVRNCVTFLPLATSSVLNQSFSPVELIVVDDGSTDGSDRFARDLAGRDPRVRFDTAGGLGLPHALNVGIQLARGKYVARMDADDVSEFDRFDQQVKFLARSAAVAVVGGGAIIIDSEGRPGRRLVPPTSHREINKALNRRKLSFIHPTVMFRREVLVACGGYREQFPLAEDTDLWLRLVETYGTANLSQVVLRLRKHTGNASAMRTRQQMVFASVALAIANVRRMGREDIATSNSPLFARAVSVAERLTDDSGIMKDLSGRAIAVEMVRSVVNTPPWRWPVNRVVGLRPRILFVRRQTVKVAQQLTAWLVEAQRVQSAS